MAHYVKRTWKSYDEVGFTRKDRLRTCEIDSYVPDPLMERTFSFTGECAADIANAEAAIRGLGATATALTDASGLTRLLLRAEAAASSRIEGIQVGAERLLRAEAAREFEMPGRPDVLADEVLANIDAMTFAMESADSEPTVHLDTILGIHKRLLTGGELERFAGVMRTSPSWIGGNAHNPCAAAYVPPPESEVPRLLADVADFCNDDSLPAVAQAAVIHAQFENIHPFVDGNGRTGRALIHVILRRRKLSPSWCPPVSLVLATLQRDYIRGLVEFRYEGDSDSPEALAGLSSWVSFFARACTRAVLDATQFEMRVMDIQNGWRERLGHVRHDSSVDLLIDALPAAVVLTVNSASRLINRSYQATNQAIEHLVAAKVLKQVNVGRRNRAFEATELVEAFTQLERRLASPAGDTHAAAPVRPVPRRRR